MHSYPITTTQQSQGLDLGLRKKAQYTRRKWLANQIADVYEQTVYARYGGKIRGCAESMVVRDYGGERLEVAHALFCGCRMCPVCQHRRSIKAYNQLSRCMDYMDEQRARSGRPAYAYLLITLTMVNVPGDALPEAIDRLYAGYVRLNRTPEWKAAIRGSWRTLEVTYNPDRDDFHPHLHVIAAVLPSYFTSKAYISKDCLIALWQQAARLPYAPSVSIERVKITEDRKDLREVSKYVSKGTDVLGSERAPTVLQHLHAALHGRKLFTSYGEIRRAMRALHLSDEDGSLLDVTDSDDQLAAEIRADLSYIVRIMVYTDSDGYLPISDFDLVVSPELVPLPVHVAYSNVRHEQLRQLYPERYREVIFEEDPEPEQLTV